MIQKKNNGLINLLGKSSGRVLFLFLTSFFAYKLSVKTFALFALFWTTLRMLTFVTANNYYIIYFAEVRDALIKQKKWLPKTTLNIGIVGIIFSVLSSVLAFMIFEDLLIAFLFFPCILMFVAIRSLSEFAKADNSVILSIFIEDFLLYFLFFIFGIIGITTIGSFISIVVSLLLALVITFIISYRLFLKKFELKNLSSTFDINLFSKVDFKLGLNYTFFRGNEFFTNFGVRYLGLFYFGDLFVSYSHIMYQFYNVFLLIIISVISGLQSQITIQSNVSFDFQYVVNRYKNILKIVSPFTLCVIVIIYLFKEDILGIFFPKYLAYQELLLKVSLIGVLLMVVLPLVYIFIYNKKMKKLKTINVWQYFVMIIVFSIPLFIKNVDQQIWLLLSMSFFIFVQGIFSIRMVSRLL